MTTTPLRIAAIILIFLGATVAWQVLGGITSARTHGKDKKLGDDVRALWGRPQTQTAPTFRFTWKTARQLVRTEKQNGKMVVISDTTWDQHEREVMPDRTDIDAEIDLDQRLRGLLWYSLYGVSFNGRWHYTHEGSEAGALIINFSFPVADAIYDDFRFVVDGRELGQTLKPEDGGALAKLEVKPGQKVTFAVSYRTRGLDSWTFQPRASGVANLRNFTLDLRCDFRDIDYPASGMSPSERQLTPQGWRLVWRFSQVLTGQGMGLVTPSRIQPGELASTLAHSAPVSLLFYFLVLFALAVLRGFDVHPINYAALAGAFFAFHLLFAYSVDHMNLLVAFGLASAISIGLAVSYLRLVVSPRFANREAAIAQLIYQVGFAAAHFLPGYTGITVSVLATITLYLLMQLTGRVRWSEVLRKTDLARATPAQPATPASLQP